MKKYIKIGLLILVIVLMGVTACSGGDQESVTQKEVKVVRGDLAISVSGSGNIETSGDVKLTFGTSGRVEEISVEKGDSVRKGTVLARLETDDLELAVTQAEVALIQAQVTVTQAEVSQQTAEYNLKHMINNKETVELALLNAQISLDTAAYNLEKSRDLYLWSDIKVAEAAVDTAEENLADALESLYINLPEINKEGDYAAIDDDFVKTEGYKSVQEQVVYAQARLDTAKNQLEAMISGFEVEEVAINKLQVEAAEKSVAQARKDLDEVAEKLADDITLKELQVESAMQSVEQAGQSVPLAQQSLDQARQQLDKAIVTAPFDGVVASVGVEVGDTVTPVNQVVHLVDPGDMELILELDEIDIPSVKVNQDVIITLDALSDAEFMGKATSIYPLPGTEGGVVLYDVKIKFTVPEDSGVMIGMSASGDIITEERTNVLLVPSRAISRDSQRNQIVRVIAGEQTEERMVVTGISDDIQTEIISGLQEGETVLVEVKTRS